MNLYTAVKCPTCDGYGEREAASWMKDKVPVPCKVCDGTGKINQLPANVGQPYKHFGFDQMPWTKPMLEHRIPLAGDLGQFTCSATGVWL